MKNVLRFLTLTAVVAPAALSASAQQPDCAELYNKWREYRNGDAAQQEIAYDVGKEFLAKCRNDGFVAYVAEWVPKYAKAARKAPLHKEFGEKLNAKDWAGVVGTGKQIIADEPENLAVMLVIVDAGVQIASGPTARDALTSDTIHVARQALQYVESQKAALTPHQLTGLGKFKSSGEIVSWLNLSLGHLISRQVPERRLRRRRSRTRDRNYHL